MPRDIYYICAIVGLIGFSAATLAANRPCDCSDAINAAHMVGETRGILTTLKGGL